MITVELRFIRYSSSCSQGTHSPKVIIQSLCLGSYSRFRTNSLTLTVYLVVCTLQFSRGRGQRAAAAADRRREHYNQIFRMVSRAVRSEVCEFLKKIEKIEKMQKKIQNFCILLLIMFERKSRINILFFYSNAIGNQLFDFRHQETLRENRESSYTA